MCELCKFLFLLLLLSHQIPVSSLASLTPNLCLPPALRTAVDAVRVCVLEETASILPEAEAKRSVAKGSCSGSNRVVNEPKSHAVTYFDNSNARILFREFAVYCTQFCVRHLETSDGESANFCGRYDRVASDDNFGSLYVVYEL